MIRRIGLWAAAASIGVSAMSAGTFAADMPVRAPPPAPVVTTPQYYLVLSGLVMTRTGPDATPLWSTAAAPGSGNLLNSSAFNFGWAGGFEGRAGVKFGNRFGLEAGGFWLGKLDDDAVVLNPAGGNVRVETNPFTSYGLGAADRVDVPYTSRIWSVEGNITWAARPGVTLLAGIRYISLRERLDQNGSEPSGLFEIDVWKTRNSLIGAQIGARVDVLALAGGATSPWLLHGDLRFGVFHNEVTTDFAATEFPAGTVFHANSGGGSRTAWATQGGLNLGYRVNDSTTVKIGYQFLYIDGVALAPNQIQVTPDFGSGPIPIRPIGARFEDVLYHGVKASLVVRR
jgi:hypothetical protein